MSLDYIRAAFDNASPVQWTVAPDGRVHIDVLYDQERGSRNRAAGHWHFQLQGQRGAEVNLSIGKFDNRWNGRPACPLSDQTHCFTSVDGATWSAVPGLKTADHRLELTVRLDNGELYLARLEPYRVSNLARLLDEAREHPLVSVTAIGETVERRPLEILGVGRDDAPRRVLIRARAHPWEPGGNWVVQGLVRSLLRDAPENQRYLGRYRVDILPMAAKDGVVRGHTRFNAMGIDLNRGWDRPADPRLAPENHALEQWLECRAAGGRTPHLAIDLHNDNGGKLHLSHPASVGDAHLARMRRLEDALTRHTWFTEGSTSPGFRNPGTFGEGLLDRFGIDACILELRADWITGLSKAPLGADWESLGDQMRRVLYDYFDESAAPSPQ